MLLKMFSFLANGENLRIISQIDFDSFELNELVKNRFRFKIFLGLGKLKSKSSISI